MMQYGTLAGIILLGGIPGMVLQNTAGLGMMAGFMKFSRNAEAEADKLGTEYLYAAGYDPSALATMFEKLEAKNKKKPGKKDDVVADHPAPADRRAASIALAGRFQSTRNTLSTLRNSTALRLVSCGFQMRATTIGRNQRRR
jgi:predicted Zn-dependent protease